MSKATKYRVGIIGHFAHGQNSYDGQIVKTRLVSNELKEEFGQAQILEIDTRGGIKSLIKSPFQVIYALATCRNLIILPAFNAIRVYVPFMFFFRKFFRNRNLHYVLIGGWLAHYLENRKILYHCLTKFDGIYAETGNVKRDLEKMHFHNVHVLPNFKKLPIVAENDLKENYESPLKICTFSRVTKKKGIGDVIDAVTYANTILDFNAFHLDLYGEVGTTDQEWFENKMSAVPDYIRYCGPVKPEQSVEVLKDYFALIFPTRHYTEGVPGTIIDAYAAGIPVISAKWEGYDDVIDDGKTGVGYPFENIDEFKNLLIKIAKEPGCLTNMKPNCIKKAKDYMPESAMQVLISKLL